MKPNLFTLIDFIFPPSDDELVLRRTGDAAFVARYHHGTSNGITSLLAFNDHAVKAAVHLAKFHAHSRANRLLAGVVSLHLAHVDREYVVIPIPLSRARQRKRGYNQVENVLRAAVGAHEKNHTLVTNVLIRTRETLPQTSLSRAERLTNVADAFGIRNEARARSLLASKHVLIVDDVTTTGSTLRAAEATLLPLAPASITLLALAH